MPGKQQNPKNNLVGGAYTLKTFCYKKKIVFDETVGSGTVFLSRPVSNGKFFFNFLMV